MCLGVRVDYLIFSTSVELDWQPPDTLLHVSRQRSFWLSVRPNDEYKFGLGWKYLRRRV